MNGRIFRFFLVALLGLVGRGALAGTVTYIHTDLQGTPVMESDAQGHITARFDYTPYGVPAQGLSGSPNGPGYTGHVNDPDTGFVYMQARYYDPVAGLFLSVDPIGLGARNGYSFNRYGYANGSPMIATDPTGAFPAGMTADEKECEIYHCTTLGGNDANRAARARAASIAANKALMANGVLGRYYPGKNGENDLALAWSAAVAPLKLQVEVGSNIMYEKDRGYTCSPAYSTGDWTQIYPYDLGDALDPSVNGAVAEIHTHPEDSSFSGATAVAIPFKKLAVNTGDHGFGDLPR
jgi:RHS repeat-associated protein